jgi:hypothetical protein
MRDRTTVLEILFYLGLFAALTGLFWALPPLGLVSNQDGSRYVQMMNFTLQGSPAISYPGEKLGLEAADLVAKSVFFEMRDGALRTIHSPLLAWLTSFIQPLLGDRAVHFLPLLCFFLSLGVLGWTLRHVMGRGPFYFVLLLIFAFSPVAWNLFSFAGHALAVLLFTGGLYSLTRYYLQGSSPVDLFSASLLAAASVFVMPVFAVAVAALVLSIGMDLIRERQWRHIILVLLGAGLPVCALLLLELLYYGAVPGPELSLEVRQVALSPRRVLALIAILSVPAVLIAAGRTHLRPAISSGFYILPGLLILGVLAGLYYDRAVPTATGLFPALLLAFFGIRGRIEGLGTQGGGALGLVLTGTVFFCLAGGATILQGGSRSAESLLLPLIPCVILVLAIERDRIFRYRGLYVVLAVLVGVSLAQGYGLSKTRYGYSVYNADRVAFIGGNTAPGDVIVFEHPAAMEHAGPLYFNRVFALARGPEGLRRTLEMLEAKRVDHCYLFSSSMAALLRFTNPYDNERVPRFPIPGGGGCGHNPYYALLRLDVKHALAATQAGGR